MGWRGTDFRHGRSANVDLLTQAGAEQLHLLCTTNVHRTKPDLEAEGGAIDERLGAEQFVTFDHECNGREDEKPYVAARRASTAAFRDALCLSLKNRSKNHKPFSQRFIKGLILAKVARARVVVGKLSDSITGVLAGRYGIALPYMQDTELVATGRMIPELIGPRDESGASGAYSVRDMEERVLAQPQIAFNAEIVLIDPRIIYHEFQHARQYSAAEEPLRTFEPTGRYETEIVEWKARQAEAEFTAAFGILY
jgi:hypothetical protein